MDETSFAVSVTLILYVGIPLLIIGLFFFIGKRNENKHLRSLSTREAAFRDFLVTSMKAPVSAKNSPEPTLVVGEVVVSSDKFKDFVFSLRNIVGGESKTFSRLFDRARREATLRMIESASSAGYNAICNVRYCSVDVAGNAATRSSGKTTIKIATCLASGTAYVRQ